jgi:hypothetical protein
VKAALYKIILSLNPSIAIEGLGMILGSGLAITHYYRRANITRSLSQIAPSTIRIFAGLTISASILAEFLAHDLDLTRCCDSR